MKNKGGYFANLNSGMLVATFFSLWLAVNFESTVEDTLGYLLILSFGILHGANDIKLLQVAAEREKKSYKYLHVLFYYIGFVLVVAALFYFIPHIALALFILFSAYHFGEQHWVSKIEGTSLEDILFHTSYGLVVLMLLFSAHQEEVSYIIEKITGVAIVVEYYIIGSVVSVSLYVLLYIKKVKQLSNYLILELFYLLVFFIVFNTASLLWAFAIYFIIWHSIPSLSDQIKYLYGDYSKAHLIKYLKSSVIYWLVSVVALILLFIFIKDSVASFLPFLFSFIAAITFPHIFVISKLNKT